MDTNPLLEPILQKILAGPLHISFQNLNLVRLHGDASNRIYYRVLLDGQRSLIVMQLPPGKQSASEEITNLNEKADELPFINIARSLKKKVLPVPEIHYHDKENRLLILEDLGDVTFEKHIQHTSLQEKESWYERAIRLLVLLQEKGQDIDPDCIAYRRFYDATLLNWEFDHFLEYGIEARSGQKISPEDRKKIQQGTNFITFALLQLPQVLVHRDFQSRNLMMTHEHLRLLDFQDALMGPLPYDLVALLRDSYIELPKEMVTRLIDFYLKTQTSTTQKLKPEFFHKMFDWMTIQRKLKDAGRFVYIDKIKGNPSFLKSIPASLRYVKTAFERQPELKNLFDVLKKYVPEFKL